MSISISSNTPVQSSQKNNPVEATKNTRENKDLRQGSGTQPDNTTQQASAAQAFTNTLGQRTGTQLSVKA